MTNKEWIEFLSTEWNVSKHTARDMLHGLYTMKRYDNVKRLFNPLKDELTEQEMNYIERDIHETEILFTEKYSK